MTNQNLIDIHRKNNHIHKEEDVESETSHNQSDDSRKVSKKLKNRIIERYLPEVDSIKKQNTLSELDVYLNLLGFIVDMNKVNLEFVLKITINQNEFYNIEFSQ